MFTSRSYWLPTWRLSHILSASILSTQIPRKGTRLPTRHVEFVCVYWLVVYLPLWKNMSSSVGMMKFPTEWKVIKHVPNHQPVYIYVYTEIVILTYPLTSWNPPFVAFFLSILRLWTPSAHRQHPPRLPDPDALRLGGGIQDLWGISGDEFLLPSGYD